MNTKKLKIKNSEVQTLIENEINKHSLSLERTMGDLGGEDSHKVEYPKPGEAIGSEKPKFVLKKPIPELLDYLSKLEEAIAILSKVAAAQADDETKKRLYNHYQKNQKLALEMIKEFGIVH